MSDRITRCTRTARNKGYARQRKTPRLTRGWFLWCARRRTINKMTPQKSVILFMAEDMGLDRPLRLSACVLPSNQSLPNDSPNRPPTALPSRVRVRATFTKNTITPKRVLLYLWRRTWDSNPRGCYTLLDFQSSSLATRSILQIICCSMLDDIAPKSTLFTLPHIDGFCKEKICIFECFFSKA